MYNLKKKEEKKNFQKTRLKKSGESFQRDTRQTRPGPCHYEK